MTDDDVVVQDEPAQMAENFTPHHYYGGAIAGYPALGPVDPAQLEAEKQRYHAQQCLQILRQARVIRQDPAMMVTIREMIRTERDDLAALLDDG